MSTRVPFRQRKSRKKNEMKQDIVAQVHKTVKRESSGSDRENVKKIDQTEESSASNKTFIMEDKNDNFSLRTPSRDVSVDGESQINSKIMSLIETEMRRDINKHSHFTDSRPQSLSFYEDERIPEELSGNLELLSPEERRHYRRRREYAENDLERNAYNSSMQDALNRENEEMNGSLKKSKSRKKKHGTDPETGLGDSREMMIPKEKRKSKKKKREYSPLSASSGKRKHRKRDEDGEPKNDITLALEELQDDVFENGPEEYSRTERIKRSPRKADKVYVQRKNKFEVSSRSDHQACRLNMPADEGNRLEYAPIEVAVGIQKCWLPFTVFCHGLLGGIALAHYLYLHCNNWTLDPEYISQYGNYSTVYTCLFYFLCIICIVSACDRYDISHIDVAHIKDMVRFRKSSIVVLLYAVCLIIHLVAAKIDDKLELLPYNNNNISALDITKDDIIEWNNLSFWRAILATTAWIIIALGSTEDLFYLHLKNMVKYAIPNS